MENLRVLDDLKAYSDMMIKSLSLDRESYSNRSVLVNLFDSKNRVANSNISVDGKIVKAHKFEYIETKEYNAVVTTISIYSKNNPSLLSCLSLVSLNNYDYEEVVMSRTEYKRDSDEYNSGYNTVVLSIETIKYIYITREQFENINEEIRSLCEKVNDLYRYPFYNKLEKFNIDDNIISFREWNRLNTTASLTRSIIEKSYTEAGLLKKATSTNTRNSVTSIEEENFSYDELHNVTEITYTKETTITPSRTIKIGTKSIYNNRYIDGNLIEVVVTNEDIGSDNDGRICTSNGNNNQM